MIDFPVHPAHSSQRVVASDEARHGGIGFGVILAFVRQQLLPQ